MFSELNYTLYIVSLVSSGTGAWIIANYGYKLGLLDSPDKRSSHHNVTPKGGGVGIMAAFVIVSFALTISKSFWVPIALLSLFSFFGDRFDISPKLRLCSQFTASMVLLLGFFWTNQGQIVEYLLIIPLSVFIVGTANFYNFMDGINGIAGITGLVGFGLLALFASFSGAESSFVVLTTCMSLSCLGFLPFNIPKAKVFMGDVGSILIGFMFAVVVVVVSKDFLDFVCLASFLFPFYADELTAMAVRIRDGDNLMQAHRRHLYQLLANEKGISHWKISAGYGLLQLIVGISMLMVKHYSNIMVLSLIGAYFVTFIVVSSAIRKSLTTSA